MTEGSLYTEVVVGSCAYVSNIEQNCNSKIANKLLNIVTTSASSERVFSTGSNIISHRRSCLTPANDDRYVFLAFDKKHISKMENINKN